MHLSMQICSLRSELILQGSDPGPINQLICFNHLASTILMVRSKTLPIILIWGTTPDRYVRRVSKLYVITYSTIMYLRGTMGTMIWIGGIENRHIFIGLVLWHVLSKTSDLGWLWPQHIPLHAPQVKTASNDAQHGIQNSATTPWGVGCLTIIKGLTGFRVSRSR